MLIVVHSVPKVKLCRLQESQSRFALAASTDGAASGSPSLCRSSGLFTAKAPMIGPDWC